MSKTANELDFTKMPIQDLHGLKVRIEMAIQSVGERQRTALIAQMNRMAQDSGFALSDIFGKSPKKSVAKYINPDDSSKTWTGHGRKPQWLVDKLSAGSTMDEFKL